MMGELLGRLHALPYDDSVSRPGGASGEDPSREGTPRQDLLAALAFLDAVDTKVAGAERERFERLRDKVRSADDGHGLPEGLLHGNLLHAPDHAVLSEQGPVAINWKASGRGPRLADFAYLIWGTGSWNPRRPEPGVHRRCRQRLPPTRRADRRRTRPARGGHVHPDALPRLLRLPACRHRRREVPRVGVHPSTRVLQLDRGRNPSRVPPLGPPDPPLPRCPSSGCAAHTSRRSHRPGSMRR